jgi:putative endonuclease
VVEGRQTPTDSVERRFACHVSTGKSGGRGLDFASRDPTKQSEKLWTSVNFSVYVLFSERHQRTYVGQTNNLEVRLEKHNAGGVRSTRPYRPWALIHKETCETRSDAMKREKWFKSSQGRKQLAGLVQHFREG